jgi:hypothetical protein
MVHERWYSEELQTVVLTESKDPMAGDITYRLAGIQRGNPPAALFEIPPDYKVEEGENEILRKVQIMEQMEQKR